MIVTAAQMKEIEDRANQNGLSYLQMMENAGRGACDVLLSRLPRIKTAAVFCGSGNNGGDGLVAARLLRQRGVGVLIILASGKPKTPDALTNLYLAAMLDIPIVTGSLLSREDAVFIAGCDAVIDGIYGTGFHGQLTLEGEICCGAINSAGGLKLALDLPSGVECDSGRVAQGAVKADITAAFHALKPCHSLSGDMCGSVQVVGIGIE